MKSCTFERCQVHKLAEGRHEPCPAQGLNQAGVLVLICADGVYQLLPSLSGLLSMLSRIMLAGA